MAPENYNRDRCFSQDTAVVQMSQETVPKHTIRWGGTVWEFIVFLPILCPPDIAHYKQILRWLQTVSSPLYFCKPRLCRTVLT